jgi:hypothetical protein
MSVVVFLARATLASGIVFAGPASSPSCTAVFQRPVAGAVVDPYRPPACRWCPGNRGIDYATSPGDPVRAAASGVVAFAGQVAGRLVIVVNHPDGLRTTYDGVAALATSVGAPVQADDVIGLAADRLHFGVRRGDNYLDPGLYLAVTPAALLVPLDGWRPPSSLIDRPSANRRSARNVWVDKRGWSFPSCPETGVAVARYRGKERNPTMAPVITMRQLLEAGSLRSPDPPLESQMKRFIFGERSIYIIDLEQTLADRNGVRLARSVAGGGTVLSGPRSKLRSRAFLRREKRYAYINERWLGGITNFDHAAAAKMQEYER